MIIAPTTGSVIRLWLFYFYEPNYFGAPSFFLSPQLVQLYLYEQSSLLLVQSKFLICASQVFRLYNQSSTFAPRFASFLFEQSSYLIRLSFNRSARV